MPRGIVRVVTPANAPQCFGYKRIRSSWPKHPHAHATPTTNQNGSYLANTASEWVQTLIGIDASQTANAKTASVFPFVNLGRQ